MGILAVNHVLSSHFYRSAIFDDLCRRFVDHAPEDIRITVSRYRLARQDVYHFHRPNRECRLPSNSVVTVHHDLAVPDPWHDLRLFLPRYREARNVVCLNSGQSDLLRQHGISNVSIIPHGADRKALSRKDADAPFALPLRLGFLSRRFDLDIKGETRLAAMLRLLDPSAFAFVFVGADRWREAAVARQAGFRCETFEQPPYRVISALYGGIHALLVLSRHEGGPASLPEALATGTPVLTTRVGMAPDFIRDGENGIFLAGEPEADAARLADLVRDRGALLKHLRQGALATEIPDWSEILARYYALYRDMAGGARKAA